MLIDLENRSYINYQSKRLLYLTPLLFFFLCYLFAQIDFRKYLMDNDSIVNEDLVAWVTIGAMHIPHSEDLPNTATATKSAHFFI